MYASPKDMVAKFGHREILELTNLDNPAATEIDEIPLNAALRAGAALMSTYIGSKIQINLLPTVPEVFVDCNCDLARYSLDKYQQRPDVRLRYEDWLIWLKDFAKGLVSLGSDIYQEPVQSVAVVGIEVAEGSRIFEESLCGY